MRSIVRDEIAALSTQFCDALAEHLRSFSNDSMTCGYAIVIGEDIDQMEAIAVTNREEDIAALDDASFAEEFRFSPDEWQHWHQDAYPNFNQSLNEVYETFRERHPEQDDDDEYSREEQAYIIDVCNMYLGAAIECAHRGDFGNIQFRLIWISDCDYPLIGESIRQLNDPKVVQMYEDL